MDQGRTLHDFIAAELPAAHLDAANVAARLQELRGLMLSPLVYKVNRALLDPCASQKRDFHVYAC
jgi:hypothetical protein